MRSAREALCIALWLLVACGDSGDDTMADDPGTAGLGAPASAVDASVDFTGPWASFAERPCPPDSALTWENFGGAFVLDYCTGCHGRARHEGQRQGAPLAVTFDDPGTIREFAERIWIRAGDANDTMPPVGGPDAEIRRLFGEWLACGALTRSELEARSR